jgi:hypothetical protein
MDYKKRITAAKIAIPAIVLIGGVQVVKLLSSKVGIELTDDNSYQITAGVYSLWVGLVNWIKNRKLGSYIK